MIEVVLQNKPDISAEDVRELIDEKKRKIGAGYLTDQGALFLVAADLGISFENNQSPQTSIKDLYIGANDVNLSARVINIYPVRKYTRRDTNEEVQNRTLTIYDKESSIKVRLWDQHVSFPEDYDLKPGDLIKISHGYTKSGLDNKAIINLGSKAIIEKSSSSSSSTNDDNSEIPSLDAISKTVDEIKEPVDNIIVTGVLSSNPRVSRYVNFRNEQGKSLHIPLSNEEGTKTIRSIIWNINEDKIPGIFTQGSKVKLIGVRVKQGNPQYSNEEFEIHGDEGTIIQVQQQIKHVDEEGAEITAEEEEEEFDGGKVVVLKILSTGTEFESSVNENFLAIDKENKNFISLVIDPKLIEEKISPGIIIEGIPNRVFGNVMYFTDESSYIRIVTDQYENAFPQDSDLETKIKNIQVSEKPYIIEAIVLQAPNTSNITTKSGEDVAVSETLIGDDTGEIRLTGWRDQSSKIEKLNIGDRVKILGAVAGMGRENRIEVTLKPFTEIREME